MTTFYFSRASEAEIKTRLLADSLHYHEVVPSESRAKSPGLMACRRMVANASGFVRWEDLLASLKSPHVVRYVDLSPQPEEELNSLVQKLRHAIDRVVDESLLRHSVTGVGFGYSPAWRSVEIDFLQPMLDTGLTATQFWKLMYLESGWNKSTRYAVSEKEYSDMRHFYEVKKSEILGLPKPRKKKYRI